MRCRHSSPVLARHPQHVGFAVVIGRASGDEKEVRQPVDVAEGLAADLLAGLATAPTMIRSARRATVRARCSAAAAGLPPGKTKDRSGSSGALSRSISPSSRATWEATMRSGS